MLHDVDLTIPAGETFAFVGETGAGKSTIAKLVNRLYDPTEGAVLPRRHRRPRRHPRVGAAAGRHRAAGGVPLRRLDPGQRVVRPPRRRARRRCWRRAASSGLGDLLDRLPDGLDTPVHERGVSLSSGERQLLALARAFLARPRILVLDEATSNLDLRSEARIEEALDALLEGRTAILIAHRLATAMRADRIAVVHDGRVVELGHPRGAARRRGPLRGDGRHLAGPRVSRGAAPASAAAGRPRPVGARAEAGPPARVAHQGRGGAGLAGRRRDVHRLPLGALAHRGLRVTAGPAWPSSSRCRSGSLAVLAAWSGPSSAGCRSATSAGWRRAGSRRTASGGRRSATPVGSAC